jgi:hypothetical protein
MCEAVYNPTYTRTVFLLNIFAPELLHFDHGRKVFSEDPFFWRILFYHFKNMILSCHFK